MASPQKNIECVKVVVRCRPLSRDEIKSGHQPVVVARLPEQQIQIQRTGSSEAPREFTFDQVYDWNSRQQDIYDATARPIVDAVLSGYNGTIFAYGQTGCGKTFTMEGKEDPPELRGIIPQAFDHIFTEIAKGEHRQYLVRATYLEIYQEEVQDLLSKNPNQRLEVKESAEKGVYVKGLVQFVVKSVAEINSVLQVGRKNRSVGATCMNQDSSRSHSVFTITVETADKEDSAATASTSSPATGISGGTSAAGGGKNTVRVGKLNLVDLAGSERQSKTGATGDRLKEATKINLSLSALGNVISALVDGKPGGHVPYRDSKLTRLLQDSLGGNTKTVMIANIGPAGYNYEETLSTLRYANRAKNITNKPRINEDPKDAMLREFQGEIARLKAQLLTKEQAPPPPRVVEQVVEKDAAPETVAAVRESLRRELAERMKEAASAQALAQARAQAEAHAHSQLEALLAQKAAGEEEKRRAHEALEKQEAELARYAQQVAADQQQAAALQAKIKAMEEKVLDGGENLLEVVDKLTAEAAAQEAALQAQKAAEAASLSRIAQLEEEHMHIEEQYSSVQEEVEQKRKKLEKLQRSFQSKKAEAADLQGSFQREREDLRAASRGADPTDIGSLQDQVAKREVDRSKVQAAAFPSARGLVSAGRRPPSRGLNI
ncbi:hypothetical protein WJX82_001623 [Trebouxia sp. C0006]